MLETQDHPEDSATPKPPAPTRSHVDRRMRRVVGAASVVFAVWMLYLLAGLHRRYGTHTYDMAIFDQGVWLLSRFKEPFVTIRGLNLFADHTSYVLLFLAPFYWIWPNPHMLMIISVGALAVGGPLTYAVARESGLRTGLSAALAFVYLLHPAVAWNAWDIFHPEVIAVPLLLAAYLMVLRNRWGWALSLLVLTLLVKEDAAVAVVPLGIFLAWRFKKVKEGLGIAAFGTALLTFNMFVVLPAFSPTGELTNNWRYAQFGTSIGSALKGMITKPKLLFTELFGSDRLTYYLQLVGGIPTAMLAPEILLVAVPITASNALSFHVHQYEIERHYTVYALAIGTIAAVSGASRLLRWMKGRGGAVGAIVVVAALAGSALIGPWTFLRKGDPWVGSAQSEEAVAAIDAALRFIPRDAAVAADWFTTPHLADRETIYMLPNPFRNRYYGAGGLYEPRPEDVDWIVTQRWALGDAEVKSIFESAEASADWETVVDDPWVIVMKRTGTPIRSG